MNWKYAKRDNSLGLSVEIIEIFFFRRCFFVPLAALEEIGIGPKAISITNEVLTITFFVCRFINERIIGLIVNSSYSIKSSDNNIAHFRDCKMVFGYIE